MGLCPPAAGLYRVFLTPMGSCPLCSPLWVRLSFSAPDGATSHPITPNGATSHPITPPRPHPPRALPPPPPPPPHYPHASFSVSVCSLFLFFLPSFRPALPTSFVGAELALDAESCAQFLAALPLCYCGPDSIDCKQSLGVLPHF